MIVETGRVTKIAEGRAWIEIARGAACTDCQQNCDHDTQKGLMLVEVRDPLGVQPEQNVQISINEGNMWKASFAVYMLPLFALIIGTVLGHTVDNVGQRPVTLNAINCCCQIIAMIVCVLLIELL